MTKKILCLALSALILIVCLAACSENSPNTDDTLQESESQTKTEADGETDGDTSEGGGQDGEQDGEKKDEPIALNGSADFVALLGERTVATDDGIICDWSGSGIEISLYNASDAVTVSVETVGACRFLAFVDGVEQKNIMGGRYFEVNGKGMITLSGLKNGNITLKIVKVTDASHATATFKSLLCKGITLPADASDAELYIEFLGNGACAGEGLIGDGSTIFADVDASWAYAYLTAQRYGADYAILADPTLALCGERDAIELYNKLSHHRDGTAYGFERKADIVVLDLGEADHGISSDATAFAAKYRALLENIRAKNGADCKVICVYDIAFGGLSNAVTDTCMALGGAESGYYVCARNSVDGKMSAQEHSDFAAALSEVIDSVINGTFVDSGMKSEASGSGITVDYKDFVKY